MTGCASARPGNRPGPHGTRDRRNSIAGTRRPPPIPALAPTRRSALLPVCGADGAPNVTARRPIRLHPVLVLPGTHVHGCLGRHRDLLERGGLPCAPLGPGDDGLPGHGCHLLPCWFVGRVPWDHAAAWTWETRPAACGSSPVARRRTGRPREAPRA